MSRRVEQQLKHDWLLGFSMGSFLFMFTLNACRTVYSFERIQREDGARGFNARELEEGAISIVDALAGKYRDANGKLKPVSGDFTKVRFATNLTPAGRRILQNLEHSTRQIEGTEEIRKLMRYATNAGRIRRGVPIFVTFSPGEKHNMLIQMLYNFVSINFLTLLSVS